MINLKCSGKYKLLIIGLVVVAICVSMTIVYTQIRAREIKNNALNDKIIYIDAGHGGKDNGASVDNIIEDSINLAISEFLLEELMKDGAYVLMSRTNDYDLASMYQANRKREDLNNRVKYINNSKPDLFISIHLNTYLSSSVSGAQVFYQNSEKSKRLAEMIQSQMNELNKNPKKVKIGDYFILNNTHPVGVLIECGFLSNEEEREKLNTGNYQMKIAKKIKDGIVNYLNGMKG